jgi:zinc protease
MLAGKIAFAAPYIGELEEGLTGSSSRKDLETMFQLIYLRFTQPRADANAFAVQATQARTFMTNQSVSPEFAFFEALTNSRFQKHPTKIALLMRVISPFSSLAVLTKRRLSRLSNATSARFLRSDGKRRGKTSALRFRRE